MGVGDSHLTSEIDGRPIKVKQKIGQGPTSMSMSFVCVRCERDRDSLSFSPNTKHGAGVAPASRTCLRVWVQTITHCTFVCDVGENAQLFLVKATKTDESFALKRIVANALNAEAMEAANWEVKLNVSARNNIVVFVCCPSLTG